MTNGPQPALTIYTDASFARNGIGSWGAVIKGTGKDVELSGQFRMECADSTLAELQAVGNAIRAVASKRLAEPGSWCVIYSDCQATVRVLQRKAKFRASRAHLRGTVDILRGFIVDSGLRFTFEWIAGHQSAESTCPHVQGNRRADALARKANAFLVERRAVIAARRKRQRLKRRERKRAQLASLACAPACEGTPA